MNAPPKPVWTKGETLAHYRQMVAEAATFHDHRDRGNPMVKHEPSRPEHDLDARGNPLRPGT